MEKLPRDAESLESVPGDDFGSIIKGPPPEALPEPPSGSAPAIPPSDFDKLDGWFGESNDANDIF